MQEISLNSVKVLSLNRDEVIYRLKKAAKDFAEKRNEILKVVLFGSLVKGDYTPYSDADILIIINDKAEIPVKIRDRIPDYFIEDAPVPVDVFPYKEKEIRRMISEGNFFIKAAVDNGKVLFYR
jgi:predicted nucleotidyltransferase